MTAAEKFANWEATCRTKAISYLKAKFPAVDEKIFYTDYTGRSYEEIINFYAVAQAAEIDETCKNCNNGVCKIPEALKAQNSRPIINISESPKGFKFLDVRWTCGFDCKFQPLTGEFGRMFKKSGLKISCLNMTFKNYQCSKATPEIRNAKFEAMNASKNRSCLIISGKPGTGKTHLAVAIAITAMEHGRQAIFRLVSTMLDEIQNAINEKINYDGIMKNFKTVPCLVLDDLGHENITPARASYLHQIIDFRYSEDLQTIVTTNANSPEELCQICGENFVLPVISRLESKGTWVNIENAKDFRKEKNL